MIDRIKIFLPISFVFFLTSFVADHFAGKTGFAFQNGNIPRDWSSYKDTLLVLVLDPKQERKAGPDFNKFLDSTFETNYHGLYKMVGSREVYKLPADKYRYIFICDPTRFIETGPMGSHGFDNSVSVSYGVVDRINQKNQYQVRAAGLYRQRITDLVIALDHARQGR